MTASISWHQVESWSKLMRHLPVSVIATDGAGTVRLWNDAATNLFGWTAAETVGQSITELTVGPSEMSVAEDIMAKVMALNVWEGEFTATRRDGTPVDIHIIDAPILDEQGALVGVVGMSVDVSLSRRDLQLALQEVRTFADVTSTVLEAERSRVARELHDDLGQCLTAVRSELLWMKDLPVERHAEVLARVDGLLAAGIESIHRICDDLRPRLLDEVGVCRALELMGADLERRMGISCSVLIDHDRLGWIEARSELVLFRVAQEALTNVERHANGVEHVVVELTSDAVDGFPRDGSVPDHVVLRITNDGEPYDGARGFGIISMQQRALSLGGRVSMQAHVHGGSVLLLEVPGEVAFTSSPTPEPTE